MLWWKTKKDAKKLTDEEIAEIQRRQETLERLERLRAKMNRKIKLVPKDEKNI